MMVVWLGSEMGDGCDDRFSSADEAAALRRRIAELERANSCVPVIGDATKTSSTT